MDTDFPVERHLLTRCFTSEVRILEILRTRYAGSEASVTPFLALVPTITDSAPTEEEKQSNLQLNPARKPTGPRKLNTRKEMHRYIKKTMARQKLAVSALRYSQNNGKPLNLNSLLLKYEIPIYEQYIALNNLWQKYMQELLFSEQKNPDMAMVLPRLSSADYNGCLVTVLEARERNIIGIKGIVLFDAQHLFLVIVPQKSNSERNLSPAEMVGGLRLLKKKGTLFGFTAKVNEEECMDFTILGTRLELRAVDRTAKKFKSHKVEGIY